MRIDISSSVNFESLAIVNYPSFRLVYHLDPLSSKHSALLFLLVCYFHCPGTNDVTPLVIDQPEDNLDSQYIYENLVADLRKVKSSRQVIIATHNPTLVTNCKAEQVIALKSNNLHGWIERIGYPTNKQMAKKILQYLEGGKKSFLHRSYIYSLSKE